MPNNIENAPADVIVDNEQIVDPADVIVDNEQVVDPADVIVDNPFYKPNKTDWSALCQAFAGEPLAFMTDLTKRAQLEAATREFTDPKTEQKKLALAAYFAHRHDLDINYCRGNLDTFLEKFDEKPLSVDQAYDIIATTLNGRPAAVGTGEKIGEGINEHLAAFGAGAVDAAALFTTTVLKGLTIAEELRQQILKPLLPNYEWQQGVLQDFKSFSEDHVRQGNREISDLLKHEADLNQEFLTDLLDEKKRKNVSFTDFTKALAYSAPSQISQILIAAAAPYALPVYIGATTAADKSYEVNENNPEWGVVKKASYILLNAGSEALFDLVSAKIIRGGLKKDQAAKVMAMGFGKLLGVNILEEGGTEIAQQLIGNALDLFYDVENDREKLSGWEIVQRLGRGVLESGLIGGIWGGVFGAVGFKSARERAEYAGQVRSKLEERNSELEAKEERTSGEDAELELNRKILSAPEENMIAASYIADTVRSANEEQAILNSQEYADGLAEAREGIDPDAVLEQVKAQRRYAVNHAVTWNIEDTVSEAQKLSRSFPDWELVIFEDAGSMAPELRQRIEELGYTPELVRAFVDPDAIEQKVYMVAGNVPPSEVAKTLGHEIIGHKGLRAVFGENFDDLLDLVYKDHAAEINDYAARYLRDPENNVDDQRYLTEEFLADCADAEVKPSWWKELIAKIRMWLRNYLPNLNFSSKDIEGVISMAARRIRRSTDGYGNVRTGTDLADGNTATGAAGLRFALDEDGGYFPAPDEWGTAYTSMSGKGLQAIEFLLKKQDGFVPAAFNRSDLGDIDIVYGRTGEGIDDDSGYGLAHIMKRHPDINWNKIVDVISNGSIRSGGKKKKIIISDDGKIILRVKQKGRNWVISAFSNTSAEEILSASAKNGSDANIYRKGIYTIGDVFDNVKPDGEKNRKKDNFRFLLAEFSEADRRDITLILKPFVGFTLDHEDRIYKEYLAKKGIAVSEKDAHAFAVFAMQENKLDRNKRTAQRREKARLENIRRRDQYLYDNFPFYREAVEFAGSHDFKIKPSGKFRGEEFSGSFIAPEFVKYSGEKAAKNSGKLDAAQGVNSDELAAKLARSWGRDALEVEQEIIDFFRELKKRDFYKEYSDFRKNAVLEDKEANRRAAEEFEAQEKFRIENEVIEVLEGKIPITEVWVKENRSVYDELYRQIMKEEPPRQPGKKDIETLNAAVNNETVDAAAFAAAYKAAREAAANEYMAKLRELRDKVMENKADAVQLQKDAGEFVRKYLPREVQGSFIQKIVKLLEYSPKPPEPTKTPGPTKPHKKYPDGYRKFMFDELIKEVTEKSHQLRKEKAIAEIHRLLDHNRTKRTSKNVPYSPMGARQGFLDRFNHISRMNPENILQLKLFALENAEAIQERLDQLMEWNSEDANDPENIERKNLEDDLLLNDQEISILENFGAMELKTADAVENSLRILKDFIFAGRNEFKAAMDERAQRIREERENIRLEMTGGNLNVDHRNDLDMSLDIYKEFVLANLSDGQLMRNFSGIDDEVKFYKSTHGKLYRMVEAATLQENNFLRDAQTRLDEFYNTHGLTGNKLGKFLKDLTKVQDTGIVVPVYGVKKLAQNQPKGNFTPKEELVYYGDESHGRPKKRTFIEIEHARKILEDIQNEVNIFGILQLGGLQNTIDLRNELKKAGFKTGKHFTVAVTDKGYRVYTDTDSQEITAFDLNKTDYDINHLFPTIPFILENNQDAIFPMDEFALESAKNKILEYDGGMAARHFFDYGDDIDNAAMEAYFNSEENSILKSRKIELSTVSQHATKRDKVLNISPEVAVQIILTAEQENYKTNMKFNGFTDDKINELKAWVDKTLPGALELGYAVRKIVEDQRKELNKAVANRYGVALPDMPNFWYANFGGGVKDAVQDAGYGNPIGGLTVSANFLTARRYHTLPVDTQVGFMSLFMRKQLETAHFIAWSEPVRELRSIYSDLEVQNNLIKEFGHEAWQLWKKRIELLATGGDPGNAWSKFFNSMNQTFYPANIMLNVKSIVTQLAGGVSYSLYMPVGEMTKRLAFDRDAPEYHRFMAMAKASGYLENRALGGLDPSLKSFLVPFAKRKNISPTADKLMKSALAGTTWADRNGALYWGYMCYDYFRELGLKRGMSVEDARKFAFDMWMRATDETQQSGEMKDLNSFNMNPGILRALTAYMTSPMQQFGLELSSIMRYMKNKSPEAKQEMIRRIVVNHFVNTTVMNLVASAFRHGLNFADYLDDWEDYLFGWFFGNLDAVAVFGKIIKNILTGQYFGTNVQLFPGADNIARDVQKISADIRGKSEVNLLDYLQATGDLLMSAGPSSTRLVGAGLYVSSREIKRIMRWFEDDDKPVRNFNPF